MPNALITGASEGLGRALAIDLAKGGWNLVIDARHGTSLSESAEILRALGATVLEAVGDVSEPQHRLALSSAVDELGGIDLLVNNASTLGSSPLPPMADYDFKAMHEVYEVNVFAPVALMQLFLERLRKTKGTIVGISSDAAVEPFAGWGIYGSSKAALDQLQSVLANEEDELSVYVFDPGDMRTAMHQLAFPGEDISDRPLPEAAATALTRLIASRPPSGRYRASEWLS